MTRSMTSSICCLVSTLDSLIVLTGFQLHGRSGIEAHRSVGSDENERAWEKLDLAFGRDAGIADCLN